MSFSKLFFSVLVLLSLTSCVETIVGGTIAGGVLTTREKTLKNTKTDVVIATKLGKDFVANGLKNPGNSVDITVNEGRVLLTGIVRDQKKADLASELAWKVKGVREVIDEIKIVHSSVGTKDVAKSFRDYIITLEIESKLLFNKNVSSLNYKVTTVAGIVYMFGTSSDKEEMQKALNIAARVRGVKKVMNHLILFEDARRKNG